MCVRQFIDAYLGACISMQIDFSFYSMEIVPVQRIMKLYVNKRHTFVALHSFSVITIKHDVILPIYHMFPVVANKWSIMKQLDMTVSY